MSPFIAELIGTATVILLGNGVVANALLAKTNGHNSGLIVITFGWAIAVFVGVFITASVSGAHLNPAVTIAMTALGRMSIADALPYILAQFLGAMLGSLIMFLAYRNHFDATDSPDAKFAVFATGPAIPHVLNNLITEAIGTFVLIFGVLHITAPEHKLGALDALPVALLVLGIGLSLGGPTGYAINPARDLGPRIMHALLPIKNKKPFDTGYAWIPVLGPIIGALLATGLYRLIS